MKKYKRIILIFYTLLIFFISFNQNIVILYASDHGGGGGSDRVTTSQKRWFEVKEGTKTAWQAIKEDGIGLHLAYIASMVGAIFDKDFTSFMENYNSFEENFINKNITVDDDGNILYSSELIALIKQALKEYAEETCGYLILPTVHYQSVNPSLFRNTYQYNTFVSFVQKYDLIAATYDTSGYGLYICDMDYYLNGDAGLYINTSLASYYSLGAMDFKTWTRPYKKIFSYSLADSTLVLHSWEEAEEFINSADKTSSVLIENNNDVLLRYYTNNSFNSSASYFNIVSKDGRRILVFKNQTALQNYSVDHRSIFFGSKFYEDSGSITGSFEDLEKWLDGKYDDMLDRIEDIIKENGSGLTEDELEKIVDDILDKLGDINDSIGDVGDKTEETNELLEAIYEILCDIDDTIAEALFGLVFSFDTSAIEEYLAYILEDLDYITDMLQDMTTEEVEKGTDSLFTELVSAFSDITAIAKLKFPLSIPWDIYNMLVMFGGLNDSPAAYQRVNAVYSSSHGIIFSDDTDIKPVALSSNSAVTYDILTVPAPRFELPLIIDSWGIDESIIVDLSGFEVISQLSRSLFSCVFVVGLINLTFKVIDFGKELFG